MILVNFNYGIILNEYDFANLFGSDGYVLYQVRMPNRIY